ncbi:hypothetical protein CIL03_11265 [Virgibacillus indicus]|uniref:Uncharacterized protein n=1 Tax=Virgibacillus indicus TaxID=2024554 RepID=A0A265NAA0_9BACI|nr:hypothetical protein [Virgibacillus indicus]OZU88226.1 hypothetical protein CIL03_11265 [Virgibacillus indicus]
MLLRGPLPKKAYKFMEPKYLKMLKESKTFFMNHLNNYPEEKLGSDNNEGSLTAKFEISSYTFNNGKSINPAFEKAFHSMQNGIKIGENSRNISLNNVTIHITFLDKRK